MPRRAQLLCSSSERVFIFSVHWKRLLDSKWIVCSALVDCLWREKEMTFFFLYKNQESKEMLCVESLLRSICIVTSQISDHVDIEAKLIEDNEMEVRGHISLLQRFRCSEQMISDRFVVQEFARTKQWKRVSWLPPNFSELCLISFRRRGSCNYGKKGRRVRFHEFYKGTLT